MPWRAGSRSRRRASGGRGPQAVGPRDLRRTVEPARPAPDRQRQRAGRGRITCRLSRGSAPTTAACSTAPPGGRGGSGGCSNIGRTKPRCCRWRCIRCCAGGWPGPSAARSAGEASRPMPASARPEAEAILDRIRGGGAARRLGFRGGQGQERLVGMGRHQARPGMAVLGRPHHHRDPARQLRAGLRPHRAGHSRRDPGAADAGRGRGAAGAGRACRARRSGIATETDLRDYFRLKPEAARRAVAELVEEGVLVPAAVEGWRQARLSAPRRPPAAPDRGPGPARAVRSPGLGARPRPSGCSASATGSRSTRPPRSGCTAITSCPSCSTRRWSPGSTSRPTASARGCWCRRRRWSRARRRRRARGSPPSSS